jgi:hypothetical protein
MSFFDMKPSFSTHEEAAVVLDVWQEGILSLTKVGGSKYTNFVHWTLYAYVRHSTLQLII